MEVSHFSSTHVGGAGIAARSLNTALATAGLKSSLFILPKARFDPSNGEYFTSDTMISSQKRKCFTLLNLIISRDPFFSVFSGSSHGKINWRLFENHILHVHNFYNFLNISDIFIIAEQIPLVMTLHDMRLLTGGCHYSMDCNQFLDSCGKCPKATRLVHNVIRRNRLQIDSNWPSNLKIVCPSNWMFQQAKHVLPKSAEIFHIPNVLAESDAAHSTRKRFRGTTIVGFAANQSKSTVKGTDVFSRLKTEIGAADSSIRLNRPSDFDGNMEEFWNGIDILFVPSRADNSPNVILEAHQRGIPVLARNVGGIPEILIRDFDLSFSEELLTIANFAVLIERIKRNFSEENALRVGRQVRRLRERAIRQHINLYRSFVP
jgi:hypothetical protein